MVTKVWDDPAVFDIQIDLPGSPLRNLNVYVIMTAGQNLLIDTGFHRRECCSALWSGIRELDLDLKKTSVFLTHLHSDHIGLAGEFAANGCPIYMGRIDCERLRETMQGGHLPSMEKRFRQEGFPDEQMAHYNVRNLNDWFGIERMFPAQPVDDGAVLLLDDLEIRCIHTPGHTPGHIVLYLEKQQLLFSGDHILFDITPNIAAWSGVPHSLADYLASLDKIRTLSVRAAFPAHRHWKADVYRRIDELQAHHMGRLKEIYQTVKTHPDSTAYQIAGNITWSARDRSWEQFPPQQKWFAMGETLAHLDYLCDQGKILRTEKEGTVYSYSVI